MWDAPESNFVLRGIFIYGIQDNRSIFYGHQNYFLANIQFFRKHNKPPRILFRIPWELYFVLESKMILLSRWYLLMKPKNWLNFLKILVLKIFIIIAVLAIQLVHLSSLHYLSQHLAHSSIFLKSIPEFFRSFIVTDLICFIYPVELEYLGIPYRTIGIAVRGFLS